MYFVTSIAMPLRQFDTQLVDDLLALGGGELRDQLLADLSRCAAQIRENGGSPRQDMPPPEQIRRDLHELRGIALTIGATGLSEYCLETEDRLFHPPDATSRLRYATIAAACDALAEGILARRVDPA